VSGWPVRVSFGEISRGARKLAFEADGRARMEMARQLHLAELTAFRGEISLIPWLDGARIEGRYEADLAQICSVTAEPMPQSLSGDFSLRVLPPGSPNAPDPETEVEIDPDAEDPPDVLETDVIDLSAFAFEHLALDLDPFPRKPGAEFIPPVEEAEISPFAVLKTLKPRDGGS
jgi:hypothetical protein